MDPIHFEEELAQLLKNSLDKAVFNWLNSKIESILANSSTKDLYLTYSLLASKVSADRGLTLGVKDNNKLRLYLDRQGANTLQASRIYLLVKVLNKDQEHFGPKVANLVQVADTGELVTFLKFLVLLPYPESYRHVAVDALRTNIATVFEAISMNNPYPAKYFNDPQWNQMYLKAAFMQLDLSAILEVDKRANKDLARIISDYAHERWAASRDIDPLFWRPVTQFIDGSLLKDMERLLRSNNKKENKAGALCCYRSSSPEANKLLKNHPELYQQVKDQKITWQNITE